MGSRFPGIEWKVIEIRDDPFQSFDSVEELPRGEIGELCVSGEVVTTEYVTRQDANALHKVHHQGRLWHRMGDVGYLDEQDRFWFCGRKGHRIRTDQQQLFTVPSEALFNQHPAIYRSALVGVGPAGSQQPVLIAETWPEKKPQDAEAERKLLQELRQIAESHEHLQCIRKIVLHPSLPVDIRHNSKIFREQLAVWAAEHAGLD